jgi:hypothetical protein
MLWVGAAPAQAQVLVPDVPTVRPLGPGELQTAQKAYEKATSAFSKRRFDMALVHAEEAYALTLAPRTALVLGAVLAELGRTREAFRMYLIMLLLKPTRDDLRYLEPRLRAAGMGLYPPMGVLELRRVTAETRVTLHGVELTTGFVGVDAGQHELVAEAPGHWPLHKKVTIPAGEIQVVEVELQPNPARVPPAPAIEPTPREAPPVVRVDVEAVPNAVPTPAATTVVVTEASPATPGLQVAGWFASAVGLAAAAGGGLALGLAAADANRRRELGAEGTVGSATLDTLEQQAELRETVGWGFLAGGGGTIVVGVALLVAGYVSEPAEAGSKAPAALWVAPVPGGATCQAQWSF